MQLAELAARQQPGQRGLVPQEEDLGGLGPVGPSEKGKPAEYAQHHQVGESH